MKFSSVEYGEKLSLGRGIAPKSRMDEQVRPYPKPVATLASNNNEGYQIGQRMRRTTDDWFKMPEEGNPNPASTARSSAVIGGGGSSLRASSSAGRPTNMGTGGVRDIMGGSVRDTMGGSVATLNSATRTDFPAMTIAKGDPVVSSLSPNQLQQPRPFTPALAATVPSQTANMSRSASAPFRPAQGTMYVDPTLGTAIPRTRELNRGTHPMYRTMASQAYGAGCGVSTVASANKAEKETTVDGPQQPKKVSDMLSYNEEWVPRPNTTGAPLATATATTTQGGIPLVHSHPNDDRRGANKELDFVTQRVGGPAQTSIGAAALEAIRKEKRYRAKVTQLVSDLDQERASLVARSETVAAMAKARTGTQQYSVFGNNSSPPLRGSGTNQQAKTLTNSSIPLLRAGGPLAFQTQILERLDSIQRQVRSKVLSRAGAGSNFEQQARVLQSFFEQHSGQATEGTNLRSSTLSQSASTLMPPARLGVSKNYFGPVAPATRFGIQRQVGAIVGQPQASPTPTAAGGATILNADMLVTALRQGFAVPITLDEADALIDHCDVDEKGTVTVKELSEGIMAGGGGYEDNQQIESALDLGPDSPQAMQYKASDMFSYLRRKRLGALAEPSIRFIILSIKARLLERSIANNKHLSPDNLAAVGSLRSYLVMILTRFPTTKALASPEDYYAMLRQQEVQMNEEVDQRARDEGLDMRRQPVYGQVDPPLVYGNSAGTNPITGAGGNHYQELSNALTYGRATTSYTKNRSQVLPTAYLPSATNFPIRPPPSRVVEQRVITPVDLLNGLQRIGLRGITLEEVRAVLQAANAAKGITPKAFVALLRGTLPRRRRQIIREAFKSLDRNNDDELTVDEVMANFDASLHPAVLIGDATAEEIKRDYMANLLGDTNGDGVISWQEFLNTYKDISDEIENDDYFELMIRNCWHLSGGSSALAANTSNKRVLVTLVDGSQRVEEIRNDIGIRAGDKETMLRRLEQQGVRGIKSIELYS